MENERDPNFCLYINLWCSYETGWRKSRISESEDLHLQDSLPALGGREGRMIERKM